MADVVDDSTLAQQHSSSSSSSRFLEILCTSSGKIRRFSPDTDAGFALQLINKKLNSGEPLALYIEAVKEGEESISFGFKTKLIHYGDGWSLHTVTADHPHKQEDETSQHNNKNALDTTLDHFPDFMESARDDVQSGRNHELHLINSLVQVNKPITSEPVSDIESQSSAKWDFTNMFTTDKVFSSRDELINWARNVGRAAESVVIIMGSHPQHIFFGCERSGKWREREKRCTDKTRKSVRKTRKCECPFRLRGRRIGKDDKWRVKVLRGHHNHPLERRHISSCGKLTAEEKEIVIKMYQAGYKGKDILQALKDRNPLTEATSKKIYNTLTRSHQKEKGGLNIQDSNITMPGDITSQCNTC